LESYFKIHILKINLSYFCQILFGRDEFIKFLGSTRKLFRLAFGIDIWKFLMFSYPFWELALGFGY
jgi:hypothetical protein